MFGALFLDKKTATTNHVVLRYYNLACSKVVEEFENPTLETIQVLVALTYYSFCTYVNCLFHPKLILMKIDLGEIRKSLMYSKLASQMAIYLELNVDPDNLERLKHENWVTKEIHRRLWFVINYNEKGDFV